MNECIDLTNNVLFTSIYNHNLKWIIFIKETQHEESPQQWIPLTSFITHTNDEPKITNTKMLKKTTGVKHQSFLSRLESSHVQWILDSRINIENSSASEHSGWLMSCFHWFLDNTKIIFTIELTVGIFLEKIARFWWYEIFAWKDHQKAYGIE